MSPLRPPSPVLVAPLLRPLLAELLALLRARSPAQWDVPTVAGNARASPSRSCARAPSSSSDAVVV